MKPEELTVGDRVLEKPTLRAHTTCVTHEACCLTFP